MSSTDPDSISTWRHTHGISGKKVEMESGSVLDNLEIQIQIQIKKNHCERRVEHFISAAYKKNTVDNICINLHISQKQNSI